MSIIRQRILASLLPVSAFVLCFGMAARAEVPHLLPVDHPIQVAGVRTACTGIGNREEKEARWRNYPVKLETVGGYGQWLGDEDVTIHGRGENVSVHCDGPWLLMGLKPGRYEAIVSVPDAAPRHVIFRAPRAGQRDVLVRFPGRKSGREENMNGRS